jgi:hypothetical protein
MSGIQTSAGAIFAISAAAPATNDITGYAALTWTTIGELDELGDFGPEYQVITRQPLSSRGEVKRKGTFNPGQLSVKGALDRANAGQILLDTASTDDDDYSAKVTLQGGEIVYFAINVTSHKYLVGGPNQYTGFSANAEIIGKTPTTTFVWDD